MESDEEIKELIRSKYRQGISEKRLKEIVAKEGFDSGIVDEVLGEKHKEPENQASKDQSTRSNEVHSKSTEKTDKMNNSSKGTKKRKSISAEDSGRQVEKIASKNKKNTHKKRKLLLPSALIILTILVGAAILPITGIVSLDNSTDNNQASPSKIEANSNFSEEPELKTIVLKDGLADPARASASSGEEILFVNRQTEKIEIEFDTGKKMILNPGERKSNSFSTITYYTAEGNTTEIKGSIYVE
jgi:hypothetical protein